jgi:excisionase family DNA binding protein
MYLSVKQVASNLGVSTTRVRKLISEGRIKGAFKVGHIWVIPTEEGKPQATRGTRGPELTWRKQRPIAVTRIHVNQFAIRENNEKQKQGVSRDEFEPVISIIKFDEYTDEVVIFGSCRVIYRPEKPLNSGAKVWIETYSEIDYIPKPSPRKGNKKTQAVA